MSAPSGSHGNLALIERLANSFYTVVPEQYRTYCSFTSQIIQEVLTHYGAPCQLVSCQIWYTQPNHIYVIGFLGKDTPSKWDGHVVCCCDHILIDAATHHFEREFGLKVPSVMVSAMFEFPTPALAQTNINATDAIWWQPPPEGIDTSPPEEPLDLVMQYAEALIHKLDSLDGS